MLIDFCDLPPTILEMAGVEVPSHFQGKSILKNQNEQLFVSTDRADESTDLVRTIITKNYSYTRVFMPFMPELRYINYVDQGDITAQIRKDFQENKLNKSQESILTKRVAEYLFDAENDPWQLNNLALLPENEPILKKFRSQLEKHLIAEKDIMFLSEGNFKEINKKSNLYEYRLSEANYPIGKIVEIAMLSGKTDVNSCKKQIAALSHQNETVKYWAAMGLKSQSESNLKKYKHQINEAIAKTNGTVKALLASTLNDKLNEENSLNILKEIILGNDEFAAYLALQCIIYQKNKNDFEQTVNDFLSKRSQQKEFTMAKSAAQMLLFSTGKLKMSEMNK
jgi:hypothetical protein